MLIDSVGKSKNYFQLIYSFSTILAATNVINIQTYQLFFCVHRKPVKIIIMFGRSWGFISVTNITNAVDKLYYTIYKVKLQKLIFQSLTEGLDKYFAV